MPSYMDAAAAQAATAALGGQPLDLLLIFQATFADSTMAVSLAQAVDAPLLLWAVPEARSGGRLRLNSLCGINLAAHGLTRSGLRYDYVYAAPQDPGALAKTLTLARAGRVRRLLKTARIGRVGEHPAGFEPCSYDGDALAARLGVQIVERDLAGLFADVRSLSPDETLPVLAGLKQRVAGLDALDQARVERHAGRLPGPSASGRGPAPRRFGRALLAGVLHRAGLRGVRRDVAAQRRDDTVQLRS